MKRITFIKETITYIRDFLDIVSLETRYLYLLIFFTIKGVFYKLFTGRWPGV